MVVEITLVILLVDSIFSPSFAYTPSTVRYKDFLKGTAFRASAYEQVPFMVAVRQGKNNVTYEGACAELTDLMADYYRMRLEYVRIDPEEFTKFGGGIAAAHQLARKEVDFVNFPIVMNYQYSTLMDFTIPVWIQNYVLMQPYPQEESRLIAPIRPFTSLVWLLFLLSSLAFIGTLTLTTLCKFGNADRNDQQTMFINLVLSSIYQATEYVITTATGQGNYVPYASRLSIKILTGTWLLAMIVLVNAYAGLLTSVLSVPKLEPTMDTFDDVADRRGWRVSVELNSDLSYKFLKASSGSFRVIGDQLRQDPELLFTDPFKVLTNVLEHKSVYPSATGLVNFYIASDLKSTGKCRLTSSMEPLLYITAIVFGFEKNSPLTELANQGLLSYLWQMGFFKYIEKKYFPFINQCRADIKPTGKTSPFKVIDFVGAFLLLGFGLSFSTIIFALEILFAVGPIKTKAIRTICI